MRFPGASNPAHKMPWELDIISLGSDSVSEPGLSLSSSQVGLPAGVTATLELGDQRWDAGCGGLRKDGTMSIHSVHASWVPLDKSPFCSS